MVPPIRIEFNSTPKKIEVILLIQKCPSLIRALGNGRNMNELYDYIIRTAVRCSLCAIDEAWHHNA